MKESIPKEHLPLIGEMIWMIVAMTIDHSEVKDIPMKEEDHLRKEGIQTETEDLQEEEDCTIMEDPQIDMEEDHLMEEDYLMEVDCQMEEDPLMIEGHLMEIKNPHDTLIKEDSQDLEVLLDQ